MHVIVVGTPPGFEKFATDGDFLVTHARDTTQALVQLSQERYDAVVVSGGQKHTSALKLFCEKASNVAVLALCTNVEGAVESLQVGAHEALCTDAAANHTLYTAVKRALARLQRQHVLEQHWDGVAAISRLHLVDRLAAGVAHEINNPLAVVFGNMSTLEEYLSEIRQEVLPASDSNNPVQISAASQTALAEIFGDVPDLMAESLHAAGRIRDKVTLLQRYARRTLDDTPEVDVNELVEATLGFLVGVLGSQVDAHWTLQPAPPLRTDTTALAHVLFTVFENALRTANRQIRVKLDLDTFEDAGHVVVRLVIEHEEGSLTDLRNRLQPLLSGVSSGTDHDLELAACARVLRQIGGAIEYNDIKDNQVEIVLRFATVTAPTTELTNPGVEKSNAPRILFIDDEPSLLRSYQRAFKRGYNVYTASNGEEAIRLFEAGQRFNAVVCDLKMPMCDGVGFYEALEQCASEQIPNVVFVAGELTSKRHLEFREKISNRMLQKPVTTAELRSVIEGILANA